MYEWQGQKKSEFTHANYEQVPPNLQPAKQTTNQTTNLCIEIYYYEFRVTRYTTYYMHIYAIWGKLHGSN